MNLQPRYPYGSLVRFSAQSIPSEVNAVGREGFIRHFDDSTGLYSVALIPKINEECLTHAPAADDDLKWLTTIDTFAPQPAHA